MIWHGSHARQKGWGYPPKKTACQSGLRFQRYKSLKSVTTAGGPAGRPLILRFLVYISRNSLRASRSLVKMSESVNKMLQFLAPLLTERSPVEIFPWHFDNVPPMHDYRVFLKILTHLFSVFDFEVST